jgi:hypothetical protein
MCVTIASMLWLASEFVIVILNRLHDSIAGTVIVVARRPRDTLRASFTFKLAET